METVPLSMQKSKGPLIKAAILVAFIVAAIITVRLTPLKNYLTPEKLGEILHMAGYWWPVIFILIYAAGVCLFIPGTLLTTLGGVIFGPYWGFVYVWAGAMAGASAARCRTGIARRAPRRRHPRRGSRSPAEGGRPADGHPPPRHPR